ncbi:MAG: DNA mismatch repair protein MutS [Chitinophagales bacterium]|nr:DNA mismatch repair protein MutS [Chitinophagales bacterium]
MAEKVKALGTDAETPLMKQYNQIKSKYPDAILLFRVGDFYETFGEDAKKAAAILGIVLTKRSNGKASEVDLAGFPHHSLDTYLPKLVRAGYRVAICDQLEDPKMTKTIVKRGVTEMVTPGVVVGDHILQSKANNFLASIYIEKDNCGVAFIDISTGEFLVGEGKKDYIDKLMQSFSPSEVIYQRSKQREFIEFFGSKHITSKLEDWVYSLDYAQETLTKLFETTSLKGFGIEQETFATIAAGAAVQYLKDTEHHQLSHFTKISRIHEQQYVWLDKFTIRNLELLHSSHPDGKALVDVIDKTVSPMGGRLIRRWTVMPLISIVAIQERLNAVEYFTKTKETSSELRTLIRSIGDLERLISKVAMNKANPRELVQLKRGLNALAPIQQLLLQGKDETLTNLANKIVLLHPVAERIEQTLEEESGAMIGKGNFIKVGVDKELDDLRLIRSSGKSYIAKIQQDETDRTGISSLKVGFNNVFGYYLEVTNTHKSKVPPEWIRKQTLANAERYITEELKEYEQKVLGAEEKIQWIEERLFNELVSYVRDFTLSIQQNSNIIARLDALLSFAESANVNNYSKPSINETLEINIKSGRHPVIEQMLDPGNAYIPNDVYLDDAQQQILMITGPNMSGKSALLRQTALIVLMAQMGSFVPAETASIGFIDKLFTRVGASDNLSAGESTFMVEMNETASIINNISSRSLILLDEIGRGTSTYDGISIAWSIAEFLHNYPVAHPRTLFATHYHELNELAEKYDRIKNFHVATKEVGNKIIFLRKMVEGGSEHSFGIHVAKMAGMPRLILDRANELLAELEEQRANSNMRQSLKKSNPQIQMSMFDMTDPKLKQIGELLQKVEINALTPIEAMMKLNEMKRLLE